MRVLICGGGVIGASIAYFLSRRGVQANVIERTGVACAASGKSGGFLALDWCDGSPLAALARLSFALHARLAQEIGGDWGYRRLTTYGGFAGEFIRNTAQMEWTATVGDYRFTSDPLATSSSAFAEIGHERNGSFYPLG